MPEPIYPFVHACGEGGTPLCGRTAPPWVLAPVHLVGCSECREILESPGPPSAVEPLEP